MGETGLIREHVPSNPVALRPKVSVAQRVYRLARYLIRSPLESPQWPYTQPIEVTLRISKGVPLLSVNKKRSSPDLRVRDLESVR